MDGRRTSRRLATAAGLALGAVTGIVAAGLPAVGTAQQPDGSPEAWIEATHLPPLLTVAGERVELRYDAYCSGEEELDRPCDIEASILLRQGDSGRFQELPAVEDPDAPEGRLVATVPPGIARSPGGFSYYAVLRDRRSGAAVTLPAGGEEAPHRSRSLGRAVEIALGAHPFGAERQAGTRVASAVWGSGPGAVGLEQGRQLTPIGGASFDVSDDGVVHLLDEANRRVLRWRPGAPGPDDVPVAVNGTIADLAVSADGSLYVLETTAAPGETPVLRAFDAAGRAGARATLAEPGSQVRVAAGGDVVVLQHPSGQWRTALERGRPADAPHQRRTGRSGRPLTGDDELVVLRRGDEIRVALVGRGSVRRAWRITSATPLAEVQLAEPTARGVVLVVRVYTDEQDEFRALALDERGLRDAFSLDSADWAETAPLSRFRLRGSALYRLGSTPTGVFVDRFDLEVS